MKNIILPQSIYHNSTVLLLNRQNINQSLVIIQDKIIENNNEFVPLIMELFNYCNQMNKDDRISLFQFDIIDNSLLLEDEKIVFNIIVKITEKEFVLAINTREAQEIINFKLMKRFARIEKEKLEKQVAINDDTLFKHKINKL